MVSEPIPYKYERKRRGQQSKGGWDCKGRVGWMSVFTMGLGCHWESMIWVKIDVGERGIYKEIQGKKVLERRDNWNKGSKWELRTHEEFQAGCPLLSLHCATGPVSFLSCRTAKLNCYVLARDRDGTHSAPNSFPLCSNSTHFVIFMHYL